MHSRGRAEGVRRNTIKLGVTVKQSAEFGSFFANVKPKVHTNRLVIRMGKNVNAVTLNSFS